MVGVAERGGELARSVEPVESEEGMAGFRVAADFEHGGGPEGGLGEVVPGHGDDVVEKVVFVSHWVFCAGLVRGRGNGKGKGNWHVRWKYLKRCRLFQIPGGRTM